MSTLYGFGLTRNTAGPTRDRLDEFTIRALAEVAMQFPEHRESLFVFADRCGALSDVEDLMRLMEEQS